MNVRYALLALVPMVVVGCSNTPPNMKCDGQVFFVATGCHPIKEGTAPIKVAAKGGEVGPSSQPTRAVSPQKSEAPKPTMVAPKAEAPAPVVAVERPVPPTVNVVYFSAGSAQLTIDGKVALNQIADYLKTVTDEPVSLFAYADPTGTVAYNKKLLGERATAVKDYLATIGIADGRVAIPADAFQIAPKTYPKDEFWRLRKVMVGFGAKANERVAIEEKKEDQVAEEDSKPAPAEKSAAKPHKAAVAGTAAGTSAGATAGTTIDETTGEKLEVKDVLYWRSTNHSLLMIAKAKGYFRDEGFDVRLHEADSMEANQVTLALAEGERTLRWPASGMDIKKRKYFVGAVCPYGLHDGLAKNLPLVQIGGMLASPNTMIMKKELAQAVQRNLSAFAGHSVARNKNAPSTLDYTMLFVNQLKSNHVPYTEKWYKSIAEAQEAVGRGEVDTAYSLPPYDQEFVNQHPQLAVYELRNLYSNMPCCRQLVMREQLKSKEGRAKLVRFERAMIRAHKFYREHKEESANLVAKLLKLDPAVVRAVFARPGFSLDPNPNTKGSIAFYNTMKDSIGKQDVREAIDTSVYEEALLALAKENHDDPYYGSAIREYKITN